jgi:DNA-binding NarL/FixJ family response regulator
MEKKINFTLVDKNTLLGCLLSEYLKKTNFFEEILCFEEIDEFWEYFNSNRKDPDIMLLELISIPKSGIEIIQKLKKMQSSIKVIAYSFDYQLQYSGHVLNSGAKAYCSKTLPPDSLLKVILNVFKEGNYWSSNQLESIGSLLPYSIPKFIYPVINRITEREKEILKLLAQQMTTQEIANNLYISKKTVDSHKGNILIKTGARNAVGLAIFAIQNQIIKLDEIMI